MNQFRQHLESFFSSLQTKRPFSLVRFGDGERAILQNCQISTFGTNRHWCYKPSQNISSEIVYKDLNECFEHEAPRYVKGISCPCCGPGDFRYYINRLQGRTTNITYANLFSNDNWRYLNARLRGILSATARPIILITNWDKKFDLAKYYLPYNEVIGVPANGEYWDKPIANKDGDGFYRGGCTHWYSQQRDQIINQFSVLAINQKDAIFLFQLGPIAKILIYLMFKINPENTYLDMGHSLDGILFNEPCRGYMVGEIAKSCGGETGIAEFGGFSL